jgi:hypothetical protein
MAISVLGHLVAGHVHHPGGLEREQAGHVDLAARLGDALLRDGLLRPCVLPKATREDARLHISSSARSARPMRRMQW